MAMEFPCRSRARGCQLLLLGFLLLQPGTSYSPSNPIVVKGSAAKPYEKKKVAVVGCGGYLGACIFGFLQRAGSLYGTGIAGINAPRAITATAAGSQSLNGVLGKNFVLAQADESFVKLTDMTSVESIRSRVKGFDAVVLATLYTLEPRPVTGGSYERTPNDKTLEFYMDRPRSLTIQGSYDPEYCGQMFQNTLEACRAEGVKRIVVIETDRPLGITQVPTDRYVETLSTSGIPYLYIQPDGMLENLPDYTYAKGVQGDLCISEDLIQEGLDTSSSSGTLYREDLAAFCAQSIMSLDWTECKVVRITSGGGVGPGTVPSASRRGATKPTNQQWCVNSERLATLLTQMM
jgi:hypothetical protein